MGTLPVDESPPPPPVGAAFLTHSASEAFFGAPADAVTATGWSSAAPSRQLWSPGAVLAAAPPSPFR